MQVLNSIELKSCMLASFEKALFQAKVSVILLIMLLIAIVIILFWKYKIEYYIVYS